MEVRWYGHVLRRDNGNVLREVLNFEVAGRRGHEQRNITWKRQVEDHTDEIGLKKEMPFIEQSDIIVCTNYQQTWGESNHLRKCRQNRT